MVSKKTSKYEPTLADVLDAVVKGFDGVETRLSRLETRLTKLEQEFVVFKKKFTVLEQRFDGLEKRMDRGFQLLRIDINALEHHLPPVNIPQLYEDVQNIKLKLGMK